VLAKEPAERDQYLIECCAGDESLRLEVESLLSFYSEAQDFIEVPPGDFAAEMFGARESRFETGQRIGKSKASMYKGNPMDLPAQFQGWIVARGGGFGTSATKASGTTRDWFAPDYTNRMLGFRLVKVVSNP
jgi:hypothetical protein